MSVYSGPEIIQNGLVFSYDMGNTDKSWRGKPTTNHIPNAAAFTGWSNYYRTIQTTSFTTEFGTTGWRFIDQPSWSGLVTSYTVPSTGTYTFSAYYKYLGGSASNNGGSVYINGWGGADTLVALNKSLIGVWQRVQITLNLTNLSGLIYLISFGGTDNGTTSPDFTSFEVTMPMIESGSFATPFVNGARTTTQSIIDLTRLNTVTAVNLTYNNNNTFSFDGVDDRIDCGTNFSSVITGTNNFSIECWVYPENTQATYADIWGNHTDNVTGIVCQQNASIVNQYSWGWGNGVSWATSGTSNFFNLTALTWNHLIAIRSGTSLLTYLNGILIDTVTNSTSVSPNPSFNFQVGTGYNLGSTRYFKGNVSNFKIYNRALTPEEVRQNYNALRGRFGV